MTNNKNISLSFPLPDNNHCDLIATPSLNKSLLLQPTITLKSPVLPHLCFNQISNHILSLNLPNVSHISFHYTKFIYKYISFNLFGHIRASLRNELKKNTPISNTNNYIWIQPDFLPKFPDNIDQILDIYDKRANCIIYATKKGNILDTPYTLINPVIRYNYLYVLHPTDLIPNITVYVQSQISFPDDTPLDLQQQIKSIIINKYNLLKVNLKFTD